MRASNNAVFITIMRRCYHYPRDHATRTDRPQDSRAAPLRTPVAYSTCVLPRAVCSQKSMPSAVRRAPRPAPSSAVSATAPRSAR